MPRVNLGRDPAKERKKETRRIIKAAMGRQEMRQKDVAEKIGISPLAFSSKINKGEWRLEEMISIVSTLHLTAEETAVILGAKK